VHTRDSSAPKQEQTPAEAGVADLPPKREGFFAELLDDQAAVLLDDANRHPEHYEEGTLPLLEALLADPKRHLAPDERAQLDRATFEFATARPPSGERAAAARQAPHARRKSEPRPLALDPEPPPFWWREPT
jgi:hypothetical protein